MLSKPHLVSALSLPLSPIQQLTLIVEGSLPKKIARISKEDPEMPVAGNSVGDDVALDHGMITDSQEEVVPNEVVTGSTFPLLKLPPELRAMVYEPLIQAGDLSILRVTKLVSQEAVPLLSKVAILRVDTEHPYRSSLLLHLNAITVSPGLMTLIAPDYIQHVNLRLNLARVTSSPIDPKLIFYFSGNTVPRKSCTITIILGTYASIPTRLERHETYQAIAALTGFKVLSLQLERERNADHDAFLVRTYGPRTANQVRTASLRQLLSVEYKKVSAFLHTTLGPAEFKQDRHVHLLRFWPSQYNVGSA